MHLSAWMAFFTYTVVTAITPGPNNILMLSSTANYGLKRSMRLMVGVALGNLTVQALAGLFSASLAQAIPNLLPYLKYLGAAYVLWLAYYVATSRPVEVQGDKPAVSFWKGYLLQLVNVKIILYGITAFTGYVLPYYQSVQSTLLFIILLTAIGVVCNFLWALAGSAFHKFLKAYWRPANVAMALLLVYSAIQLLIG